MEDIDPKIDYQRLGQLSDEFTQLWTRLQAFYLDAAAGFALVRDHVEAEQRRARSYVQGSELDSEEFQNALSFTYSGIFTDGFVTSGIHRAAKGEVKARNAADGINFTTLGQLCLISFYDYWNDYLRREYVVAKGYLDRTEQSDRVVRECLRKYARNDLWGDLYYLRTSIVHNRGVAISDVAKCKIIKWFAPGDAITITPERMRAIFMALLVYRNELNKEQYPPPYIQFTL